MNHFAYALALALLLVGGCSSSTEDRKEARKEVVDSVHQPLDKAKGVEQQILDNAAEQRKQVDDL